MKKKLAVYANGWSNDALSEAMTGIRKYAAKEDFDVFVFMSFASYSEHVALSQGELNIYKLGYMDEFDGAIVFSTMLNSNGTAVSLCKQARDLKLPVVSIGMEIEGVPSIGVNNEQGMRELVEHLVEKHGVKNIMFMGGTPDHVDSMARLRVTREVLEEHGYSLGADMVCYGEWGNEGPKAIVDNWVESGKKMPDAIVCANDVMALATATELLALGYTLPDDVIVTGFDNIAFGKFFYPAMSSVKQNYEDVGYRCCELIFDQIYGREYEARVLVPSSFALGESCGCQVEGKFQTVRKDYCQRSYQRHIDASVLEQTERVMRQRISGMDSYQALKRNLKQHFAKNHQFEGDGFALVLHSEYYENPMADEKDLWEKEISDRMEVIVTLRDNNAVEVDSVDRHVLIPDYRKVPGEQHIYYLLPLHYYQYNYGYVVMRDEPYIIREDMLYP